MTPGDGVAFSKAIADMDEGKGGQGRLYDPLLLRADLSVGFIQSTWYR